MREEFIRRRLLHDFSRVHQRDVMRHLADNREVMRDEEKRQTAFRLESEKQIENLFLQRHIERRGRLIRDHEVRVTGKRHRDHAALFLPAGKLERERVHAFLRFRNADPAEPGDLFLGFLLRAETMKLSGLDFITAARACGTPSGVIMRRHILPNVLHIILIVSVIGFSDIVLYEAVLSYIGVGVDPSMNSFGSMINAARNEMSRTPTVWWNLFAAFIFMVAVVLSANLFASAVRDAFDPRSYSGSGK